ncbi:hypothetical protein [Vitiosangium sp. GDMCC 1.1324]|uniref:hypothetical protein n=1 Tax=Vitiosangium sp. (strain GDMCC 1.1324) TaxID=2138576 RepID=UPI000D33DC11|nr:hypothetical protein [Vitiosangium sp. GDMCC 1.1324]PTL82878.1 hypothetical protein DAT35_18500 [Vitiosangium sp. GDMCC 1.1324]
MARVPGGRPLEAHGGYLIRVESLGGLRLMALARQALVEDGAAEDTLLSVSVYRRRKIIRLALDGPHSAGRRGSHWYSEHHALARLLSRAAGVTVHSYVYDPQEYEEVMTFGGGHHVGGERLQYEEVELPECLDGEFDDEAFARMQSRWPMGHLAWVYGVERELLLQLHRMQGTRLAIDGSGPESEPPLEQLLRGVAA